MNKGLLSLILVIFFSGLKAQTIVKSQELPVVSSVFVSGKMSVEVIVADSSYLEASIVNADVNKFNWVLKNDKLTITFKGGSGGDAKLKLYLKKQITEFTSERCEVMFVTPVHQDMLSIKLSASAILTGRVDVRDFEIDLSGSSLADISGKSQYMTARVGSGSRLDTRSMDATSVTIEVTTNSEAFIKVIERLNATAKMGSVINYIGKPEIIRKTIPSISMGASINDINR